ncbi:glutamine amidotransferase-related protein [Neolewinella antarctica]|uniref:GMP synthase-like glutamine amidotransferase n=1 Tax=Neolewinella antarctica TaxID=442734 RepID=A0ABX0XCJ6_9BACT|nr:GMP synthase [Neolewinella antarctica]NJC26507.1 GMP synthase-like glutamine amidotransferase [Neolewinella antarctica]
MSKLKLAILDLYNGIPNQGMRCIKTIVESMADRIEYDVFDVRQTGATPDLTYDIYISSGGPGHPIDGDGVENWEANWNGWLDTLYNHNKNNDRKKHVFFICHSFQMAVHHFRLATITKRKGISFGTFPMYPEAVGAQDPIFKNLEDPFWAADFRRYQAVQPDEDRFRDLGAEILVLEKDRPHVDLERAIMAVRWTPEIVGVQFHPEADPDGMLTHFSRPDIKQEVITDHGRDKWLQMMEDLSHPERITLTHDHVIPTFLRQAIAELSPQKVEQL